MLQEILRTDQVKLGDKVCVSRGRFGSEARLLLACTVENYIFVGRTAQGLKLRVDKIYFEEGKPQGLEGALVSFSFAQRGPEERHLYKEAPPCSNCGGSGGVALTPSVLCPRCKGIGLEDLPSKDVEIAADRRRYWYCVVGPIEESQVPLRADLPMLDALNVAFVKFFGRRPAFCASSWGTEGMKEIIEKMVLQSK